jgi:N-acetylneuraminate synthase
MNKTYVIAEAGVNHNGSMDMAIQLIDAAVEAGADAVKFQSFISSHIVSKHAQKADYQKKSGQAESQLEMLRKLELSKEDHQILIKHCHDKRIEFLSTPFDIQSSNLLIDQFHLKKVKISSGDITNAPLLHSIALTGTPIILSTGICLLGEIEQALGVLAHGYLGSSSAASPSSFQEAYISDEGQLILREKVILLHCNSEYPTPPSDVNLRVLDTLTGAFQLPVGYSDHTAGISIAIAAVARGAVVIEKHFTLDKLLPGPDHQASLDPQQLITMISAIREVEYALGSPMKHPTPSELKNKAIVRKSLIARKSIRSGDPFDEDNLTVKRPGHGIEPIHFWDFIGKTAARDYEEDDVIDYE